MKPKLPSIYFLHIAKTAGSSLAPLIRCAYPQELVLPVYEIEGLLKLNREDINKYECFTGHFGTGLFSLLDQDIPCVTMLRDPFERAVSSLYFAKKTASSSYCPELSDPLKQYLLQNDLKEIDNLKQFIIKAKLSEIVNDPLLSKMIENIQTLYLGYNLNLNNSLETVESGSELNVQNISNIELFFFQELLYGLDLNEMVRNAKQRLDQMEVVGIVENFNDSAELICKFLGIPLPQNLPRENVSPEKLALGALNYRESGQIPDDVIRRIDELTACDREIYEYGKKLFNQQLRSKKKKFFGFFSM